MKLAINLWFTIVILFLGACTESDQYLYVGTNDPIEINAYIAHSFDSGSVQYKSDTISPGDSLFFISKVSPSKSLRTQAYYWTMDNEFFANEYSFKNAITKPGFHQISFIYVDYFGDTLTDSISIAVGTSPMLDSLNFIPANGTQQLNPAHSLNFAWNAQDPDSLWNMYFHFTLQELTFGDHSNQKTLVDTILHQSTYTYFNSLSPLKKYLWTVQAFNDLKQTSAEMISSYFYVTGPDNKGAILGQIATDSRINAGPYSIILQSGDSTKHTYTVDSTFSLSPISSGKYKMIISSNQYTDYGSSTLDISLLDKTVLDLGKIILSDSISPIIQSFTRRDTLDPLDTLKIIVKDGGGKIANLWIRLDGSTLNEYSLSDDTLSIPAPFLATSWSYKILSVIATDFNDNRTAKSFYITPKTILPEGNNE